MNSFATEVAKESAADAAPLRVLARRERPQQEEEGSDDRSPGNRGCPGIQGTQTVNKRYDTGAWRLLPSASRGYRDATATADAIGIRIIRNAVLPERRASALPLNAYRRTVTSDETSVHDAGDRE